MERRRIADAKEKRAKKQKKHAEVPVQPEFAPRRANFFSSAVDSFLDFDVHTADMIL